MHLLSQIRSPMTNRVESSIISIITMLSQCLVGQIQIQKPTLVVVANWISMLFRLQSSIISIGSTITNDIKRIARKKERTNNGALRNISINRKLLCRLHIRETVARRCSVKKVFLKYLQNQQKNLWLRPVTLLKKRLWHVYFPVNVMKFLRTPFLQNTSGRKLLESPTWSSIEFSLPIHDAGLPCLFIFKKYQTWFHP